MRNSLRFGHKWGTFFLAGIFSCVKMWSALVCDTGEFSDLISVMKEVITNVLHIQHMILYSWHASIYSIIYYFSVTYILRQITVSVSASICCHKVNTFGRIVEEIRGNIFPILASIRSIVTSLPSSDEMLMMKLYPHMSIPSVGSERVDQNTKFCMFKLN